MAHVAILRALKFKNKLGGGGGGGGDGGGSLLGFMSCIVVMALLAFCIYKIVQTVRSKKKK